MRALLSFLAVLVAVLFAYLETLGGPFLWDDRVLILGVREGGAGQSLGEVLRAPFWQGDGAVSNTSYFRPLVKLSFAFDAQLHGANAGGYHLTNVVLHLVNAWLVLALLRRSGVRSATAGLLATAWALSPRLAEAAAWISGRTDLLATAFTLAALLAWERAWWRRSLAAGLVLLGLLAKESALAGVVALVSWETVRLRQERGKLSPAALSALVAPLIAVVFVYGALRLWAIGLPPRTVELGVVGRVATCFEALGTYVAMLVDVYRPRAVIGRMGVWSPGGLAAGGAVLLGTLFLVFRLRRQIPATTALALGLGFGALLPVLHIVPLPLRTLVADRFLYLPSVALVLGVAPRLERWLGARRSAWLVAVAFVLSLGYTTQRRVALWSDESAFWVETFLETPRINNAAATELVGVYYRAALWEDALALAKRGLDYDDPNRSALRYDVADCLSRLGRLDEARAVLGAIEARGRLDAEGQISLGLLELRSGEFEAAQGRFAALAQAGNPQAREILRRFPELVPAVKRFRALGPDAGAGERATLAALLGDDARAAAAWTEALKDPNAAPAMPRAALEYFVRAGSLPALVRAAKAYEARVGPLEPETLALVELRLGEVEKLVLARPRLGLPTPASERR